MGRAVTIAVWVVTGASALLAYLAGTPLRWIAIAWIGGLGFLTALGNWSAVFQNLVRGGRVSLIPLLGGLCLALAFGAISGTRFGPFRMVGAFFDPWLVFLALSPLVIAGRLIGRRLTGR